MHLLVSVEDKEWDCLGDGMLSIKSLKDSFIFLL